MSGGDAPASINAPPFLAKSDITNCLKAEDVLPDPSCILLVWAGYSRVTSVEYRRGIIESLAELAARGEGVAGAACQKRRNFTVSYRQPNSAHCFVCGLHNPVGLKLVFYDNGLDEVRCEYTIPPEYNGYPGVAHGGIVAAILDEVVGRISMIGDPTHFMMTAKMEVKYRLPVPVNTPLVIVGRRVKQRGRIAQAVGEVRLPDGTVAVEADLTLVDLPDEFKVDSNLDELGWKVYP